MMLRSVPLALLALIIGSAPLAVARAQDLSAHCASVGNDDRVQRIPAELVSAARRTLGLGSAEPDASLQASTVFRCMSGKVWLCNHGANLTLRQGRRPPRIQRSHGLVQGSSRRRRRAHGRDGSRHDPCLDVRRERGPNQAVGKTGRARVHRQPVGAFGKIGVAFARPAPSRIRRPDRRATPKKLESA